jgi:alpha-ketoglutarate-dependent taurine dioxygenase
MEKNMPSARRLDQPLEGAPLTGRLGCKVQAPKRVLLEGSSAADIRRLLVAHGVLCFPDVALSDEEQLTFARTLGKVVSDWDVSADKTVNRNERLAEYQKSSIFWHFDGFGVDVPEFATIMSPRVLENGTSGATEFANCYAAYADLASDDKQAIDRLQIRHSFEALMRLVKPRPSAIERETWRQSGPPHPQPLVWHHASGKNSLLLGASACRVEGISRGEGQVLIDRLNRWITQSKYVYRYEWKIGDLVIWDNTGVLHRAVPYAADSKRLMHRTTILGHEAPA